MDKLPYIDSLSTFIHHKKPHKFCFVGFYVPKKGRDLSAFLGVKSGLLILVRVKPTLSPYLVQEIYDIYNVQ